ncbi:uncharacterized protein LODBEIA_P53820 [Lodderomyces beijingensis]|uniref:PCI domain-containing protein n=1 Tax=Lodderomyces beijingensis TaxID=1775926 RepID=A0ABP0ZSP6_9ASCO
MSREDPIKAEKDFTETLNQQLPEIEKIPDYKERLEKYLLLEKQTRQSSDVASSKRVLAKIVATLAQHQDWDYLNDLITTLSKKHGQLKSSIQSFIKDSIKVLDELNNSHPHELETKIKLIETIRTVTDKKIFVEVERAVVSRQLADIYLEQKNDLDKAVEIMNELQVETYSLMPFKEKIEFILEQIRLTLEKKDYNQAKILSRKILLKSLKDLPEFKVTYLKFVIEIYQHEYDYDAIVQNFLLLIQVPTLSQQELQAYSQDIVFYNLLDSSVKKLTHNEELKRNTEAKILHLLEIFSTDELINKSIDADYDFKQFTIFKDAKNFENLEKRIIEHNLRVINKFYQAIKLDRLAFLLQLPIDECEKSVSQLVNEGMITAKINRPKGVVKFSKTKHLEGSDPRTSDNHVNGLLNDWCFDVDKLLEEVDSIGHLINKEEMMYGIKQKV